LTWSVVRRGLRAALFAAVSLIGYVAVFFGPGAACADTLLANIEFDYSRAESKTRNGGVETGRSDVQGFTQRYRLTFDKSLYPSLVVRGGGLFEKADTSVEAGGNEADSTATRINPYVELAMGNPLYNATIGYNHQEFKQQSGNDSSKLIRDSYTALAAWRPVKLPELTVTYTHYNNHDPARTSLDTIDDIVTIASRYQPTKSLDLFYTGNWEEVEDRLRDVKTETVTNSGRVTYDDNFLKNRLFLHTNYNVTNQRIKTSATTGSVVTTPFRAVEGLFALDDSPLDGVLTSVPALIDGNLTTPAATATAPAGIDIGLPALSDPNRLVPRNMGNFLSPAGADVNGLWVWVGRSLTPEVAGSFRWAVYVSPDGLVWTLWQAALPAPFEPFENRFNIQFPRVLTRYVKVVVDPLAGTVPGALLSSPILVTELQAYLTLSAEQITGESNLTTHQVNVAARAQLLDKPALFYDFTLYYTTNQPNPVSSTFISNGLSLTHKLNPWLTGSAQVGRDDENGPAGNLTRYRYSVSFNATPIPTIYQSAVFSGSNETAEVATQAGTMIGTGTFKRVRNSIFLTNRATLYRGINVFLNGGASWTSLDNGVWVTSYTANSGVELTPNDTMTWSFFGSEEKTERGGGDLPDSTSSTKQVRASVSWNPLPTMGMFASAAVVNNMDTGSITVYNWSLNWSPFREGTLQMIFAYNETLRPDDDGYDRVLTPSLRWEVRRGTFLDLSYTHIQSKTFSQETENSVYSANFNANF